MTQNTEHQPSTPDTLSIYEKKSESGRKRQMAVMGGILAGLATVGTVGACVANNSGSSTPEVTPKSGVEAPVVPGEVEATSTVEPATEVGSEDPTNIPEEETPVEAEGPSTELPAPETLRLSAELPPEALVQDTYELWSDWLFADATKDTIEATKQARYDANVDLEEFKSITAQENADYYSAALLPDNWQEDPFATQTYNDTVTGNMDFIGSALSRFTDGEPVIEHDFTITNVDQIGNGSGEDILIDFDVDSEYKNNTSTPSTSQSATFRYKVADDGTARLVETSFKDR